MRPGIGAWTITPEQSAAYYLARGLAAGEQADDDILRCPECEYAIEELVRLDDQDVCVGCLVALTEEAA